MCVVSARQPDIDAQIGGFEIGDSAIRVLGVQGVDAQVTDRVVHPGDAFEALRFNGSETWRLVAIDSGHAEFDVRGKIYGCVDPFAIVFGIPSSSYRKHVLVCPHVPPSSTAPIPVSSETSD